MPNESTAPAKVIRGTMPTVNYAARMAAQVPGSNKTLQYLQGLDPQDPGQQGFYREALNDIPHPLETGKQINYGQLQSLLHGQQRGAVLDAYAQQNRLARTPTADEFQAHAFAAAKDRMLARGAATPGELAFPQSADAARRAPNAATAIAHGNFVQPTGGAVVNAASLAQRSADLPADAAYAAPGMAVRLVRGAAPVPLPRVIPGTIASR